MGHIKEPKGVDFVIASDPLTDKARKEITEFIRNYKNNISGKKKKPKAAAMERKPAHA
jgi:hypothetical protein